MSPRRDAETPAARNDDADAGDDVIDVPVREGTIRLGQFLKLADLVEHGAMAKELIDAGEVSVDGEPELRRGAQLRPGQIVELDGVRARPVTS